MTKKELFKDSESNPKVDFKMLKKRILKLVILISIYLFFLFLLIEIISRLILSFDWSSKKLYGNNSPTWRIWWVKDHDPKVSFQKKYIYDDYDSFLGWKLKKNLSTPQISSNSDGVRGKQEYSLVKSDKKRFLVLGDSFTFGEGSNDDETYVSQLSKEIPDAEFINFGVHGYGFDQMLLKYKQEGLKYKSDYIILGFIQSDMDRNILSFRDYEKPYFQFKNNKLVLRNTPVPAPQKVLSHEIFLPKIIDVSQMIFSKIRNKQHPYEAETFISTKILNELIKTIRENGSTPILVYLPSYTELSSVDPSLNWGEKYLNDICQQNKLICDFTRSDFITASNNGLKYDPTKHYNVQTNQVIAKSIKNFLLSQKYISP